MIWTHKGKLHWVSHDLDGVDAQVRVIEGISHWAIIDTETGEVLYSGECPQALDAMRVSAEYIKALEEIRHAFEKQETDSKSEAPKAEVSYESTTNY